MNVKLENENGRRVWNRRERIADGEGDGELGGGGGHKLDIAQKEKSQGFKLFVQTPMGTSYVRHS